MKMLIGISFFFLVLAAHGHKKRMEADLPTEVNNARERLRTDYIDTLWYNTGETIITSHYNMLKLYTQSTIEQAQQVVDYIAKHSNVSLAENAARKKIAAGNATLVECIQNYEIGTVKAFKATGYNLHNCIRMAQLSTETKYLEILKNFEKIKASAVQLYSYYTNYVTNCLDVSCVMTTLIQSVVQYEKLQEELSGNVTEVNNLSSRYLLTNVAMGCVANSITQIYDNYNIGKGLANDCRVRAPNATTSG